MTNTSKPPPPGHVKGKWGALSFEGSGQAFLFVVAFLACGAGAYCAGRYLKPASRTEMDQAEEMTAIRAALMDLKARAGAIEAENAKLSLQLKRLKTVVGHNDSVIAQTVERMPQGAKLEWNGRPPVEIDFHPPPHVGSRAPAVQPRAVLELP